MCSITVATETHVRRTATAYCIMDSLAEGQRPPFGEGGGSTRATAIPIHCGIMYSASPDAHVRELC
jgi:hypothetical protein